MDSPGKRDGPSPGIQTGGRDGLLAGFYAGSICDSGPHSAAYQLRLNRAHQLHVWHVAPAGLSIKCAAFQVSFIFRFFEAI